jgi:hypothetical protein
VSSPVSQLIQRVLASKKYCVPPANQLVGNVFDAIHIFITATLFQPTADTRRAAELTRQLLLFSRRQVMQSRILDLNEVVMNLTKMLQRIIWEDVKLELSLHSAPLMVRADAGMLDQVLMNLALNARDAMTRDGRLYVKTSETSVDEAAARSNPDVASGCYVCWASAIQAAASLRKFSPDFRTVFHHQRSGQWHGAGAGDGLWYFETTPGLDQDGQSAGSGSDLPNFSSRLRLGGGGNRFPPKPDPNHTEARRPSS